MAVWQFHVKIIPQRTATTHGLFSGGALTDAQRENIEWWGDSQLDPGALLRLRNVLPPGQTWTEELDVFGELESTCVTIFREGERPRDVNARIDLRVHSGKPALAVLNFARSLECLLVTEGNTIFKPEPADFVSRITVSSAYSFMKEPLGFLSDLLAE